MKISVLGLGYIGLPTALLFAKAGIEVAGYDVDQRKLDVLTEGKLPFSENGLETLFSQVKKKHTFSATNKLFSSDAYVIAVPTPQRQGKADLTFVLQALKEVRKVFKKKQLIIIESTIGPRDCVDILIPTVKKWGIPFGFVHCPERAIPGNTLVEMVRNNRIIGAEVQKDADIAKKLYSSFVKGELHITTTTIAASAKVMENTYRAVNIALANEFSRLAKVLEFNVWEAIELANKHPRVTIHQPGPGVGGHCIPIDPWFFINTHQAPLIEQALHINEEMPNNVCKEIDSLVKRYALKKPTIGVLGFAYKKNVDDSRETPAAKLVTTLKKKYSVLINDPMINNPEFAELNTVLKTAQVIILTTDHDSYQSINFKKYPNITFVYDTRDFFTQKNMRGANAQLHTLGIA